MFVKGKKFFYRYSLQDAIEGFVAIPPEDQLYTAVLQKRYGNSQYTAGKPLTKKRQNSWTKYREKSSEFSSLLFSLYSFALKFLFLQTHATSHSFCKRERRKT